MEFKLHKDFSSLSPKEWNALVEASISDTPFSRHEYLSQWWKTLGGGEWKEAELVLITASEGDKLVGIAPLFQAHHDRRPALLFVGSIEISDYLDLIVCVQDLPRFLSGLIDFLAQSGPYAGLPLDFYNLPDASPTLAALQVEAEKRGWTVQQEVSHPTPRIALSGDFENYLASLEKKQRHELRRKMRRAAEDEAAVRFYVVEDAATLNHEIEAFFTLMAHDPSKAGFLTESMRTHMAAVLRTAFENSYLWLGFLESKGIKVAASLNFDYKNKLWGYNSGVNRDFTELSPGWVLLGHTLQWACEHRRYEFDFMRGDEEYKYRLGGVNRYVMRACITPKPRTTNP